MFETVVPEVVRPRSRKLFYEMLPVSVGLHIVVVGAVLGSTLWNVAFPTSSPKMFMLYSLTEPPLPPPPPPPPPPPAPKKAVILEVKPVVEKMPEVAPNVIPDLIPEVLPEPAPVPVEEVADPAGVKGGVAGGIAGGEVGGVAAGTLGGLKAQPLPDMVKIERDLPLPMTSVSQDFPTYPEYARSRGWEDVLVVRYVIDKRGRVREVSVIKPPEREEFVRPTLSAIRDWRFHPFLDVDGTPKEVVHELTVEFKIARRRVR